MNVAIDYETKKAYKEVNDMLNIMGPKYKNKLPNSILVALNVNEAKYYKSEIKSEVSFIDQKMSRKALAILTMLNLKYWVEDEKQKQTLKQIYLKNDFKYQKELREKYDINKIFQNKKDEKLQKIETLKEIENNNLKTIKTKELAIIKDSIFSKIKNFIFRIFNFK